MAGQAASIPSASERTAGDAPPSARPGLWAGCALAAGIAARGALPFPAPSDASPDALSRLALGAFTLACALFVASALVSLRGSARWGRRLLLPAAAMVGFAHLDARTRSPADFLPVVVAAPFARDAPTISVEGVVLADPRPYTPRGALARFVPGFGPGRRDALFPLRVTRLFPDGAGADAALDDPSAAARRASGTLLVRVPVPPGEAAGLSHPDGLRLRAGDRIRVDGRYSPLRARSNPGEGGRLLLSMQARDAGNLSAPSPALVRTAESGHAGAPGRLGREFLRFRASCRAAALDALRDEEPGASAGSSAPRPLAPGRALLSAMLLGERETGADDLHGAMSRLGLAHLVAISGVNMTLLALCALWGFRAVSGSAGRWRALLETGFVLGALALYTLILPAQSSIHRAALIAAVVVLAEAAGRRYDRLNTLGWAAVAVLLWRPADLFTPGLQLSFGCVGALIALAPRVRARFLDTQRDPAVQGASASSWARLALPRRLAHALADTLAAWAVATPIVLFHVGLLSGLAIPLSLVLVPATTALMALGYAHFALVAILPSLGDATLPAVLWCADALARAFLWLDSASLLVARAPRLGMAWTVLTIIVLWWWLGAGALPRLRASRAPDESAAARAALRRRDARRWLGLAGTGVSIAWLALAFARDGAPPRRALLSIDTLDAGDGTTHLIRARGADLPLLGLSRGEAALWDCGAERPAFGLRDLPQACRALGAARVRTVIVSHPDIDHFIALLDIIEPLGVRRIVVGEAFLRRAGAAPNGAEAFILARVRQRGVRVETLRAGDTLRLARATAHALWPPANSAGAPPEPGAPRPTDNNLSLVVRFDVATRSGTRSLLMTGDIERPAMNALLDARPTDLPAQILELPHHGSGGTAGAAGLRFVAAVNPVVVLQSTGPSRIDDPRWAAARAPGRAWLVTARDGPLFAAIDESGTISSVVPPRPVRPHSGASVPALAR